MFVFTCCVLYSDINNSASDSIKEITTLEQLENIRVGIFGVSANKELIENKNPKITNFLFYNTLSDAIAALKANKVDCFATDIPLLKLFANRNPDLKVSTVIINGIPPVVLLMMLYYVIFGSINISPVLVSILAFTLCFGSACYFLIGNGIQAVNIGQEEAAKALGFSEFQSFYKIVFPQAARQFLPLVKGQFMEMVKMTSVVGYVACIDLTKASDLIRSRTMEAFFPLIVTALIYFIISYLMIMALNKIEISLDPKRRERSLPGIKL